MLPICGIIKWKGFFFKNDNGTFLFPLFPCSMFSTADEWCRVLNANLNTIIVVLSQFECLGNLVFSVYIDCLFLLSKASSWKSSSLRFFLTLTSFFFILFLNSCFTRWPEKRQLLFTSAKEKQRNENFVLILFSRLLLTMNDIRVSFAFLTPKSVDCCYGGGSSDSVCSSTSLEEYCDGGSSLRNVLIKLLEFEAGCSRVFRATCPVNAPMSTIFDALRRCGSCERSDFVAFEPVAASSGEKMRLTVSKVLSSHDTIPFFSFCQRTDVYRSGSSRSVKWLAVNIFVSATDGELFTGHVPFLVPLTATDFTKAAVLTAVAEVLCMNAECKAALRQCAVLSCSCDGRRLTLEGPFLDASAADQVALIYNAADVGDVVVVSAPWHRNALKGQAPIVQGVLTRRFVQDGVVMYDIKELNTAVVMERLTCTQFVPL